MAQCRAKNSLITRVLPSVERVVHSKPSCPTDSLDAVIAHNRLQQFSLSCMREYCIFYPSFIESLHMTPALCVRVRLCAFAICSNVVNTTGNSIQPSAPQHRTSIRAGSIYIPLSWYHLWYISVGSIRIVRKCSIWKLAIIITGKNDIFQIDYKFKKNVKTND